METNNEKLSLWDRLFNRYRKVIVQEGDLSEYRQMAFTK